MQMNIMKIRFLTTDEGKFLCNMNQKVVSSDNKIFLAKDAVASDWIEISAEEKEKLEKQWEDEALAEIE